MKHALVVLAALILGMSTAASADPDPALSGSLLSLLGARQWLNTQPLRPEDLRGKVILVNFWTYSCINSLRALPYVREWAKKYRDRGLVVIGVQTPEFAFEKDVANVSKALVALDVDYPVAIDNDYGIWRAFDNEAWPAFYFIGADGWVRQHVFGEGGYDKSERLIQQLLSEADGAAVNSAIVPINGKGPEAAADESDLRSDETYIGYDQAEELRFSRRRRRGCSQHLSHRIAVAAQPMELDRRLDDRRRVRHAERCPGTHLLPFSRPRSQSRIGRRL